MTYPGTETKESHTIRNREYNKKVRLKAFKILGEFCWACGIKEKLCLHHVIYEEDSIMPGKSNGGSRRQLEAIKHPERFMVLCKSCHARHHQMEIYENYPKVLKILITKKDTL